MSSYTEKDASKDTDSSIKDVKGAWHQAKDDDQEGGGLPERGFHKGDPDSILGSIFKSIKGDDESW